MTMTTPTTRRSASTKWILVAVLLATLCAVLASAVPVAYSDYNIDPAFEQQVLGRLYRNYLKSKRSPSIGLSLAEYMATPQGQDNFHFIPNGRR